MGRFALDLSLEVVESSTHNLGDLTLWCRLRANTYNPLQPRPQLIVVWRTDDHWSPPAVSEPVIDNEQVAQGLRTLVRSLVELGGLPSQERWISGTWQPRSGRSQ